MIDSLPPGLILLVGGLLLPLVPRILRAPYLLALPVLGLLHMIALPADASLSLEVFGVTLELLRVDKLALLFGYVFHLAAFLGLIYALGVKDTGQQVAALTYAGSAIAALFAGDLLTLFVFWELTAFTSVFLIWARRTERSYRAGMRYLLFQVGSGVALIAGVALYYRATGSIAFDHIGTESLGGWLIFLAFGIKCAFPLLHGWLHDAYPEATITGTVFLSAFTTKLAIYALARGFAGTESMIWIGAVMAAFPIFYAVIENDLRKVLAYSTNNQLGFMVVGIGIGTELALNGAVAHAFAHVLFKALLFMSMGAVLLRAGTVNGSQLGGLYKSMPWTTVLCIVGAASISAFPLFSGFVSKSLINSATADNGYVWVWFVLLFASAGVFHHSGIKIPYFAFFAHDSGLRVPEAPPHMLVAMTLAAVACIAVGVFPDAFYRLLPFATDYAPYTATHVVAQLQLLLFSALAFAVLVRTGIYPPELRATNLDVEWLYRRLAPRALARLFSAGGAVWGAATGAGARVGRGALALIYRRYGPEGRLAGDWPTGSMALWVATLLVVALVLHYL